MDTMSTDTAEKVQPRKKAGPEGTTLRIVPTFGDLPEGVGKDDLVKFFHESMKPYHDTETDVGRALEYALGDGKTGETGGFLTLATEGKDIVGGLLMLDTGMGGYVPSNLLLFVATVPGMRGKGLGGEICRWAIGHCKGDVKLHVEHDNPAKRLYERLGFTNKYLEMRLAR